MGSLVNELVDLNHHNAANPISFNVMNHHPQFRSGEDFSHLQVEDHLAFANTCQVTPSPRGKRVIDPT